MQHAGLKNLTTIHTIFEEGGSSPSEDSFSQIMSAGFSMGQRQKAFQTRNESSIPMLKSYRTLDFEGKDEENDLIETALGNKDLAQALNRNSQIDYVRNISFKEYWDFRRQIGSLERFPTALSRSSPSPRSFTT